MSNDITTSILTQEQLDEKKKEARKREIRQNVKSHCTKIKDGIRKNGSTSGNRAIWELFQNAGDLAECAEIKITLTNSAFIFAHKGKPFTYDTLCSLVKQVSSEEKEDEEKVGQYGTGFLTTHKFSRKITIQSSMLISESPAAYVDVTEFVINRENFDDIPQFIEDMTEQIEAVEKLMDAPQKATPREWTELSYELNEERRTIAQVAIDEAIKLIPFVLTFNDNIGHCTIDDQTRDKHISFSKDVKPTSTDMLFCKQITRQTAGEPIPKVFNCYYLELHEGKSRIILPLKSETEVISFGDTPRLFVHYPLIGQNHFNVNFLFHSHLFTPEEPRDNIIVPRDNDATKKTAAANKRVLTEMTAHLWSFLEANVIRWTNTILMAPIHIKDKNHGDAKTDEYYKALKSAWIEEYTRLPLLNINGTRYLMAHDQHPLVLEPSLEVFLSENEERDYLSTIYGYASQTAIIPVESELLQWSRIINEWNPDKKEWFLTLDAIVKYVSENQGSSLKKMLQLLVDAQQLSFFESYALLPNREMTLMKQSALRNAEAIVPELYTLVKDLAPSICTKFVHSEYTAIIGLTSYSRTDLRGELQDIVKKQEDECWKNATNPKRYDGNFLKHLIALCSCFTSDAESKRSLLMPIICQYEGIPYNKQIIPAWKDDAAGFDLYRQLFLSLVENEMMLIASKNSAWVSANIDTLVTFVDKARGDDYKSFCTRYATYPDMNFELHTPDALCKNSNVHDQLFYFYKQVLGEDLKSKCVNSRFETFYDAYALSEKQYTNQTVANKVHEKLANDKYSDTIILDIIDLTEPETTEGLQWRTLFNPIYKQRESIRYNLGTDDERKAINRMMKQKNPDLLKKMAEVSEMEDPEEVLNRVEDAILQAEHDAHIKKLGDYVECHIQHFLSDALESIGVTVSNQQGGQDLILSKEGYPDYFVEIKSRWQNNASAIMSATQFQNAVANADRYSLISAQMWTFDQQRALDNDPVSLSELTPLIKVCSNIGHLEDDLQKRVTDAFRYDDNEISIQGSYEVLVPQKMITESFEDLIDILCKYFSKKD